MPRATQQENRRRHSGSTGKPQKKKIISRFKAYHGVITPGPGEVVHPCPPLIIEEREIDDLPARIEAALDDTLLRAREERLIAG